MHRCKKVLRFYCFFYKNAFLTFLFFERVVLFGHFLFLKVLFIFKWPKFFYSAKPVKLKHKMVLSDGFNDAIIGFNLTI